MITEMTLKGLALRGWLYHTYPVWNDKLLQKVGNRENNCYYQHWRRP